MNPVLLLPLAATLGPAPTPADAPDIRSIVPPQPYLLDTPYRWWLALAALLLVLAGVLLWWRRRRRAGVPPLPSPRQRALRQLDELAGRTEALDARAFGGAVADVLRVYIAAQYRLHPERQTSPEFLASISGSRAFPPVEHALLTEFLTACDLLKFARADATPDAKNFLLGQARDFLEDSAEPPPALPLAQGLSVGAPPTAPLDLPLR